MDEQGLLKRITVNPKIFGGKPIIRGRRLAVEHVLGMLAAGERLKPSFEVIRGWKRRISKPALPMPTGSSVTNELSRSPSKRLRETPARYVRLG